MNNVSFLGRANNNAVTEAVIFFDQVGIAKEMLYSEFEAVLDNVVGLNDFAAQEMRAVFLVINAQLQIEAACFFLITFEQDGSVDSKWNIPLRHLVDQAGRGPDLGGGPIRMACRSQCPISWHERDLWDPAVKDNINFFHLLKRAVKENRLGLLVQDSHPAAVDARELDKSDYLSVKESASDDLLRQFRHEYKRRAVLMKEEFKLQLAALKAQYDKQISELSYSHQVALVNAQEVCQRLQENLNAEKQHSERLQAQLSEQLDALELLRQEVIAQNHVSQSALDALKHQYEAELSVRIKQETDEMMVRLDQAERDLQSRDETIDGLYQEIRHIRAERDGLIESSGDQLLKKMASAGITFVAYHPGLDHLTVPPSDITTYLNAPYAYVAERCGVSEKLYQQWLNHYQMPICNHSLESGKRCGMTVFKVGRPSHFVVGESDRCSRHSSHGHVIHHVMTYRR